MIAFRIIKHKIVTQDFNPLDDSKLLYATHW